jgi:hypothetical protein
MPHNTSIVHEYNPLKRFIKKNNGNAKNVNNVNRRLGITKKNNGKINPLRKKSRRNKKNNLV